MNPDENQPADPALTLLQGLGATATDENLTSQPADENPDPAPEGDENQPAPVEPLTLNALLEKADISHEDFYALELPTEAGVDPVTLGQAKDMAKTQADKATQEAAKLVEHQNRENEVMGKLREASMLHELLPAEAKSPEVQRQLVELNEQHLARERSLLAMALPDWSDPQVAQREQTEIVQMALSRGFTEAEVSNISDHRVIKAFRDLAHLNNVLSGAEAKRTKAKPTAKSQRAPAQTKAQRIASDLKAGKLTQEQATTLTLLAGLE